MIYMELTADQRRRLVDAKQAFAVWREARNEFRHGYRGSMRWKRVAGKDYLYRVYGNVANSLGVRSAETERIKADYTEQRTRLRRRVNTLENRLKAMDKLNRAADLGRVPEISSRILRRLDSEGLLGKHLYVVGTHSLYAYEAAAGVVFEEGLTATADIHLLWDVRRRLSLALVDVRQEAILGLLKKVDHSFSAPRRAFRTTNDSGFLVDLIRPLERDEIRSTIDKLGMAEDELHAAAIIGLQWLINAPKFEEIAIGADGRPLWMSCIDPRAFALHKYWMSKEASRDPVKKARDASQAKAVALVAAEYLDLKLKPKDLSVLPKELVGCAKELIQESRS